ncbi:MAG: hypothetical protein U0271_28450 [Polyangiaceae bacterium]
MTAAACAPQSSTKTVETEQSSGSASASTDPALPEYLARLSKSGDLYARDGDKIVDAPAPDIAVLRGYPAFQDKGPLTGPAGERLTILTAKTTYLASEEIRVIHVHEATKPGAELYVMGPKAIYGEYIDDVLVSAAAAAPPAPYDGAVLPSPNADHNYEVSVHHLAPGTHRLQWRFATLSGPTVLSSNVLVIEVK